MPTMKCPQCKGKIEFQSTRESQTLVCEQCGSKVRTPSLSSKPKTQGDTPSKKTADADVSPKQSDSPDFASLAQTVNKPEPLDFAALNFNPGSRKKSASDSTKKKAGPPSSATNLVTRKPKPKPKLDQSSPKTPKDDSGVKTTSRLKTKKGGSQDAPADRFVPANHPTTSPEKVSLLKFGGGAYATPTLIRVAWILSLMFFVLACLTAIGFFVIGYLAGMSPIVGLLQGTALIISGIVGLIYMRMLLELIDVLLTIGSDLRAIRTQNEQKNAS